MGLARKTRPAGGFLQVKITTSIFCAMRAGQDKDENFK
jgi:hypothetical protein